MIYLLLAKAEQLGLFDSIVHVAPHVRRDGTYVAAHERHQKVRQDDLFWHAEHGQQDAPAKAKARKLIDFVKRKGGAARMGAMLAGQPQDVVSRMVDGFVKETGMTAGQVRAVLGLGGDLKPQESPESRADAGNQAVTEAANQDPIKNEKAADAGSAAESAPSDQEQVKKPEQANPTQGQHEISLDSVLVKWTPRFRSSVPPQYPTLAAKQAGKVFRHVGSIEQLRLSASVRFMGQGPSQQAIDTVNRMNAALKAGFKMKKVKVGTQGIGVIFVRDGKVLTPAGADALMSGFYDREKVDESGDHERYFSGRINADAKMLARWMAHLPESTLESPSAFASKLNNTQIGQHLKIERNGNGWPVISSRDEEKQWRFYGKAGESYQDTLRRFVHFAAGDASEHWASQMRAADEAAEKSKADGKSLKDVLREAGFEPESGAEVGGQEVAPVEDPAPAEQAPKEGDTKTIAGIEYRLQDGRWHRVTPEESAAEESAPAAEAVQVPQIVEHVTKKGKTLRGIIRTDLTKEQAQAIDAYTFRKDGGWFIRDKHLETSAAISAAHANGHITDEQHQVAQAANATGGPAAAKEALAVNLLAQKAAKLRSAGQALAEKSGEERSRERLTNTDRRARMAAGSEADAAKREATGKTMMKLADAIEAGEVPALVGVTTRAAVEELQSVMNSAMGRREQKTVGLSYSQREAMRGRAFDDEDMRYLKMPRAEWRENDKNGLISRIAGKRGAPDLKSDILRSSEVTQDIYDRAKAMIGEEAVKNVLGWYAPEQLKRIGRLHRAGITSDEKLRDAIEQFRKVKAGKVEADPVKIAERAIVGKKVGVDFFPTPKALAERMTELAGVGPGSRVLEPSAGNGNLADAAKAAGAQVDTVEVSDALRNILEAKGHSIVGRDFENFESAGQYDAVIMNPPFSDRMDAAHIMRAWDMVKPGGKLVAISGEGVFFGTDKKAQGFRDWLDTHGAEVEKLPAGTFEDRTLLATTSANARLIIMQKPGGPQEGDRKTVDGVEYVLENGRWHRAMDPVPEQEPEASTREEQGQTAAEAELAEDREDLREEMMTDPHGERAQELVRQIAAKEEAMSEPKSAPVSPERRVRAPRDTSTPDDLNPNSPNYRYRDTGYIGGSRKEAAAERIKSAAKTGQRVRATDIDWTELETNTREAQDIITKSHLFGKVDWEALKTSGMEPGAGFLIDRIYASVATEPAMQGPQSRQDYALGLESLRDRLERCKTPDQVVSVLNDMRAEWNGQVYSANDSDEYREARERYVKAKEAYNAEREKANEIYGAWRSADGALYPLKREQESRIKRGWKPSPELAEQIERLQAVADAANEAVVAWQDERRRVVNGRETTVSLVEEAYRQAYLAMDQIDKRVKARNMIENPLTRAWATLGERFLAVMNFRRGRGGSSAFAKHVATVQVGGVKDWSWAEKEVVRTTARKRDIAFQLRVADKFDRVGGKPVAVGSTQALKDRYGLRDVQSGNWVLKDPKSAEFHVQRSAEAFSDLADLLGVPEEHVSAHGRLALAFGARGTGNAGWRGAERAEYEGVHRIINLTKMGGGGALGHEWWHAFDNLMAEAESGKPSGAEDYASENPNILPPGELRDAINGLRSAMLDGTHRATENFTYTARDFDVAKHNISGTPRTEVAKAIQGAPDAEAAVAAVDKFFSGPREPRNKKQQANYSAWRVLAVAWHDGKPSGGEVGVKSGRPMSSFALEAMKLDGGDFSKYWSSRSEMSARAFQSWVEDRLAAKGQRNDYLSAFADNKYYDDPLLGPQFPYPEGEERERINAAFDRVFDVVRKRGVLAKAFIGVL